MLNDRTSRWKQKITILVEKTILFLNPLFIHFFLILGKTDSTKKKTAPNLIQIVDQIHPLLNLLAASVSLTHTMLLQTPGWVVTNNPIMAGLLVPCFPQTRMNKPCLSPFPGSLSWEDKKNSQGILSPYKSQRKTTNQGGSRDTEDDEQKT